MTKIKECQNESNKAKEINEDVTKSFKEFNQEAKDFIFLSYKRTVISFPAIIRFL